MWYLIVSIPDLCTLTYFVSAFALADRMFPHFIEGSIIQPHSRICRMMMDEWGCLLLTLYICFKL